MDRSTRQPDGPRPCAALRAQFQDYLDGALPREGSLEIFLHVRDCADCRLELEQMRALIGRLESLPPIPPPPDFDARILAAVPYEAYRQMEPIRRDRVPVFLEEHFLPAFVRARTTRAAGVALSAIVAAGLAVGWLPDASVALVPLTLAPELLVRLQRIARRRRLAGERSGIG